MLSNGMVSQGRILVS